MVSHHSSYSHIARRSLLHPSATVALTRPLHGVQQLAERIWGSTEYAMALVALATLALCSGQSLAGCVAMAGVATFMLLFCSDIFAALLPMVLFCLLTTSFYDSLGTLMQYWPVFALAIAALIAHFTLYSASVKKGVMTYPLMAVSAATLLGGVGSIALKEYVAPVSMYYVLGLGAGMLMVYTMVRSQLQRKRSYDVLERFMNILYYAGVFSAIVVIDTYITHLPEFLRTGSVIFMSYRNFCTTILLLALPATCITSPSGSTRWIGMTVLYGALLMSGSRSGLLFGTAELFCCMLWLFRRCPAEKIRIYRIAALLAAPVVVVAMVVLVPHLFSSRITSDGLISFSESRVTFFAQALKDFLSNPLFGIGLGNMSNKGIFIGVEGSIVFYHNAIAQVLGSMGLVGVVAYGWQYLTRVKLLLKKQSPYLPLAALSIAGMVLVSLTNPGEFCPLPYEFLIVALFAVIEQLPDRDNKKLKKAAR